MTDEDIQALMSEVWEAQPPDSILTTNDMADALENCLFWTEKLFTPMGLQRLFPGLKSA